ncbi:MAG TPA: hypothetical protein VER17_11895 [Tepidisphaeraceae bacterium]|nr:hypothetical protein [Tepidisphaeraceae bacterium]
MSRTSKSPRAVALEALVAAERALPPYAHRFSPRKFTQHQLFALLVLKTDQRLEYSGFVALLGDMQQHVSALGLRAVPHFTTLQKAAARR